MANAQNKNEVQVVEEKSNVPAYLKEYSGATGAENIDNEDISIPRIKLAQGLSPEVQDGTVPLGALFLNITGEVLAGPGDPLRFVPIATGKEYIIWNPDRNEGIIARARRAVVNGKVRYEWDQPNAEFDVKIKNGPKVSWRTGKFIGDDDLDQFGSSNPADPASPPAATRHHNFIVALPDHGNMIAALSLSRSQEKRAKDLNAMFKLTNIPIFARFFYVRSVDDTANGDSFKNFKFAPAGFVQTSEQFELYKGLAETFSGENYVVDQTGENDSATDQEVPF